MHLRIKIVLPWWFEVMSLSKWLRHCRNNLCQSCGLLFDTNTGACNRDDCVNIHSWNCPGAAAVKFKSWFNFSPWYKQIQIQTQIIQVEFQTWMLNSKNCPVVVVKGKQPVQFPPQLVAKGISYFPLQEKIPRGIVFVSQDWSRTRVNNCTISLFSNETFKTRAIPE